jgi:hypothetical protein
MFHGQKPRKVETGIRSGEVELIKVEMSVDNQRRSEYDSLNIPV